MNHVSLLMIAIAVPSTLYLLFPGGEADPCTMIAIAVPSSPYLLFPGGEADFFPLETLLFGPRARRLQLPPLLLDLPHFLRRFLFVFPLDAQKALALRLFLAQALDLQLVFFQPGLQQGHLS